MLIIILEFLPVSKILFVFFQRSNKMSSQKENPYLFDTFNVNADNENCHLQSARLTVGNGIWK